MKKQRTYLDIAFAHYKGAEILESGFKGDKEMSCLVGFHLQQSVEFAIRHLFEKSGMEYVSTHDIDQLIRIGHKHNLDFHLTEYIDEHAEMLSWWRDNRNVPGYSIQKCKIDCAMQEVGDYLAVVAEAERKQLGDSNDADSVDID